VLGITQQPGKTVSESVAAALEGRSRLLVFDNCEHVLDAAADQIEAILARSATVKMLATSREGLRVADEQLWPVPSLDVLSGVDSAAATLFMQRAGAVAPGISLAGAEADAVVEICRRFDGIPLAIELAASRMQSMTVTELRDRLDDRFRLLVGSRRGLERHQTLRHAVQWSHDLLDDTEKALLARCSVFAGGFDLAAADAVGGCGDDLATLDVLDALVRKSLLVADRSSGRTRFSMLETIRQFAEEQLVASGAATEARTAHARYFAGREADIMSLWDSPRQRDAYDWFTLELANLRAAFRWATDHGDLDVAAPIATSAAWLGFVTDNYEPTAWVEELIEPARANDHPRLTGLYAMASLCYMAGRNDAAIRYTEAAQTAISSGRDHVPYGAEAFLGSVYPAVGQPERWIQSSRAQLARGRDTHSLTATSLVIGLAITGSADAAMEAANGLIDAAEATGNPLALSWALLAYGVAGHDADPVGSLAALRRALAIAQDSGNRFVESTIAYTVGGDEAEHGDPLAAFDYFTGAIGNFHDSGNAYMLRAPLGFLATFFDRLGRYEPAATIAGFVVSSPLTVLSVMAKFGTATAHLRNALGEATYESLARQGAAMTTAEMVTYAYDQIDQARAELNAVSK
jgi:predicted ATPase